MFLPELLSLTDVSGITINKYLNNFAKDHDLVDRIRLETLVTKVERTASGGWSLQVDNGPDVTCDKLIWAVGGTSSACLPKWPQKDFSSPILHSNQVGDNLQAIRKVRTSVVVGGAKSALDTVYMLLKAGKKVDWVSPPLNPCMHGMVATGWPERRINIKS